jgi:hypothetical protein
MSTLAVSLALALPFLAAAQEPPVVEGKELPKVAGPITGSRFLADGAPSPGDSAIDLAMRRAARHVATLPGVAVPPGDLTIRHGVSLPAGWMAYQVQVEPGEKVRARLRGDHEAWFRVKVVNRFGQLEKGMLQNLIPKGDPEASYLNPTRERQVVYVVVDTVTVFTGDEPYTLTLTREVPQAKP